MFKTGKDKKKTFTLTEYPDKELIKDLWTHPDIDEKQVVAFMKYCDKAKDSGGSVKITYIKYKKYGRYYIKDTSMISSCPMWSALRSSLFKKTEWDVDIINAHNVIMYDLFKTNDYYQTEKIKHYIDFRDDVINDIWISKDAINNYNTARLDVNERPIISNLNKKDFVKTLFTILLYGGNIDTWTSEKDGFDLNEDDYKLTPFVDEYIQELQYNMGIFMSPACDTRFIDMIKEIKQDLMEKTKKKYPDPPTDRRKIKANITYFNIEKYHINNGKILSYVLQDYERVIIEKAMTFMLKQGLVITSYNYDGFQVKKREDGKDFIIELNERIAKEYDSIKFLNKPFKDGVDLNKIPKPDESFSTESFKNNRDYGWSKKYFEMFHFKCFDPPAFIKIGKDGYVKELSEGKLKTDYRHLKSYYKHSNPMLGWGSWSFLDKWLDDEYMKTYSFIDLFPPPLTTPKDTFNLWTEFPILKVEYDETADTSLIHQHFKIMGGGFKDVVYDNKGEPSKELEDLNKKPVYEYLLDYFAHIVKYPARKTEVCILLKGLQGAGKSFVSEKVLDKLIGKNRIVSHSSCDKAFGRFSDLRGMLLCVLNEASGKDTHALADTLKDAITAPKVQVEKKGIDTIPANCYCNFIFTTNGFNAVHIPVDDRRFLAIACCNSKKNNKAYFDALLVAVETPKIMRKFYEELIKRPIKDFHPSNDRPFTHLGAVLKSVNKEWLDAFVEYLEYKDYSNEPDSDDEKDGAVVVKNPKEKEKEVGFVNGVMDFRADALWCYFQEWWKAEARKADHLPTRPKFAGSFEFHERVSKRREASGQIYQLTKENV